MNTIILLLSIIFICNSIFAQAPEALWFKTYGGADYDAGNSVIETSNGNYVVAGVTTSFGNSDQDIWLIKTDHNGDTLWTQTFGGNFEDGCGSVIETSDYGYLICGYTKLSANANEDIWLIKTDINGNLKWSATYGAAGSDKAFAIQKTNEDDYIVAGFTDSYGAGKLDMLLIKINENGDSLWTRTYGGNGDDRAASVQQCSDGGFILVGSTDSYGAGRLDMIIVKTDADGDTLWTKVYGDNHFDYGNSVQETSDGGYIVAGYTTPAGNMYGDVWIIKLNTSGNIQWERKFGGQYYDFSCCVKEIENRKYLILASTESIGAGASDIWIIKIDEYGNIIWDNTYGDFSFEYGLSFDITNDSGLLITGKTASNGAGYYDIWLIKIASIPDNPNQIALENKSKNFVLNQNYPNPFNHSTTIEFSIPINEFVKLTIYNLLGQEVETIINKKLSPGNHIYEWDASSLASGIYYYEFKTESGFNQTRKLLYLK